MMTNRERLLAAFRGHDVDHVPLSMHFWHDPRHPRASWRDERERLAMFRAWEWDTSVDVGPRITPSKEVRVEVSYEHGGTVLHQAWQTPAGTLHERLRVTEDWEGSDHVSGYLWFLDDFRPSRMLEPAVKGMDDVAALEYLFPRENAADTEAMVRYHAADRALADEFQVPLTTEHRAGLDWLTWMFSAAGAVLLAMDRPELVQGMLAIINRACLQRLEVLLDLGVDAVVRSGWYESADYWSPALFDELARPLLGPEIEMVHRAGAPLVYLMDTGIIPLLPALRELPFDCLLGADPVLGHQDFAEIRRGLPGKCLWSGLSGPEHLGRGTPEQVTRAVEEAFAVCGRRGFILGMGVGIRQHWPAENLVACEQAWRRLR